MKKDYSKFLNAYLREKLSNRLNSEQGLFVQLHDTFGSTFHYEPTPECGYDFDSPFSFVDHPIYRDTDDILEGYLSQVRVMGKELPFDIFYRSLYPNERQKIEMRFIPFNGFEGRKLFSSFNRLLFDASFCETLLDREFSFLNVNRNKFSKVVLKDEGEKYFFKEYIFDKGVHKEKVYDYSSIYTNSGLSKEAEYQLRKLFSTSVDPRVVYARAHITDKPDTSIFNVMSDSHTICSSEFSGIMASFESSLDEGRIYVLSDLEFRGEKVLKPLHLLVVFVDQFEKLHFRLVKYSDSNSDVFQKKGRLGFDVRACLKFKTTYSILRSLVETSGRSLFKNIYKH